MKCKLYILTAMLLSAFSAAGVAPCTNDSATAINPCKAGREFTMRIPVRLPAGVTAEYVWYRNGFAIPSSLGTVGAGGGMVTYTIPATGAWGVNQQFYFQFRLSDDDCADCWDSSPQYLITWNDSAKDVGCKTSGGVIVGDTLSFCAGGAGGEIRGETLQQCTSNSGGIIQGATVALCAANAGGEIRGTIIALCSDSSGGEIRGTLIAYCNVNAGGEIAGERLDQFPTDGYNPDCVFEPMSGGEIAGAMAEVCDMLNGGLIHGDTVAHCGAADGGEIRGEVVQQCSTTDGGEIRGETIQQCSANDGGEIRGEVVQQCGSGDGGKIGNE